MHTTECGPIVTGERDRAADARSQRRMTSIVAHDCKQHTEPTPISHADAMRLAGTLIARQLRHEAQTAADSEDFGRGVAHAARVVEGIVAAMGRAL